jgi:hypothetical protein
MICLSVAVFVGIVWIVRYYNRPTTEDIDRWCLEYCVAEKIRFDSFMASMAEDRA